MRRNAELEWVGKRGGVESGPRLLTKREVEGDEKRSSVSIMLRALSGDGVIAGEKHEDLLTDSNCGEVLVIARGELKGESRENGDV